MQKNTNPETFVAVHTWNFIKECTAKVESKLLKITKK